VSLVETVQRFRRLHALVIGDLMLDSYLEGSARRLCREGPVPVVQRDIEEHAPGGAANAAANLRALGATVTLLGVIGADEAGRRLQAELESRGIDLKGAVDDGYSTLQKMRIVADGQYVVRFDTGAAWRPSRRAEAGFLARLQEAHAHADLVVVSDYAYGVVSPLVIDRLRRLQAARPLPLIVDGKDLRRTAALPATAVTPNHHEAAAIVEPSATQATHPAPVQVEPIARKLLAHLDTEWAAVTMAAGGVLLVGRDGSASHIPAHPVAHASDVGAGDSFTAAMALALAAEAQPVDAATIAVEAAGLAVTKSRTAVVEHGELLQRVSLSAAPAPDSLMRVERQVAAMRAEGKTVVFTNGVFDILHAGHVQFLRAARDLGDSLVVGLNSDRSARLLKGKGRPVNGERDRAALVAALDAVDHVVVFDEETPEALIRVLKPSIHVKGGDYAQVSLPETAAVEACGGRTIILPLWGDTSTTIVIERILRLAQREGVA
jgi:D-beta-D-heptose 7-phosphate kinase / D-beta-D-heptose 1-phosphate adenosyltransferase